jgi:tRNA threonylcarbamoyladenosine biosynthesis protein TsaB
MNILTIDTANEYLSLAISSNNISQLFQDKIGNKQSEHILPTISRLLQEAKLTIKDINAIAYNMGPGSFTGLRIGLSVALGLAYSINSQLYPASMFMLYAQDLPLSTEYSLIVLDARLGQIYVAAIRHDDFSYLIEPCLINPNELHTLITKDTESLFMNKNALVTGNGWQVYQTQIDSELYEQMNYHEIIYPSPESMLGIVKRNIIVPCSTHNAELLYLRNKVALDLSEQLKSKQK